MYKEIPLQGYDGFVACDDGHIYKKDNFDYMQVKEYSQDGYLLASIPNNKFNQVHRIIASTFCLNSDPSTKRIVDHKDGNKLNNYESIRGCLQTGKSVNGLHFERKYN